MTDTNKLDLILQTLQAVQGTVVQLDSRMEAQERRMDTLEVSQQDLKLMVRTLQASQEFTHARLDGLEKSLQERTDELKQSLDAHRIQTDSRFQQLEERLEVRTVDLENQIGSLRENMVERFHNTWDYFDTQAKMLLQSHQFNETRNGHRYDELKRHFDGKLNQVHERFVEVQEDLDMIRQQTARHTSPTPPHTPRRSTRR